MNKLIVAALAALLICAAPVPASAFCFGAFHKPKVTEQRAAPATTAYGVPVAARTVTPKEPESFCKLVMRSAAVTLVVQTFVIGAKVGIAIFTGIPIL